MKYLVLLFCLTLSACAGSNADNDFRSKVSSVTLSGTGGSSADGSVSAGAGAKFDFRAPSSK